MKSEKSLKELLKDDNNVEKIKKYIGEKEKDVPESHRVNKDFLLDMIKGGFIDEDYRFYVAKSYEAILNSFELEFLLNLKNGGDSNYTLELPHVDIVASRIFLHQWSSRGILNISLFSYILDQLVKEKEADYSIDNLKDFVRGMLQSAKDHGIKKENGKEKFFPLFMKALDGKPEVSKKKNLVYDALSKFDSSNRIVYLFEDDIASDFKDYLKFIKDHEDFEKHKFLVSEFLNDNPKVLENLLNDEGLDLLQSLEFYMNEVKKISQGLRGFIFDYEMYSPSLPNLDLYFEYLGIHGPYQYYSELRKNEKTREVYLDWKKIKEFSGEYAKLTFLDEDSKYLPELLLNSLIDLDTRKTFASECQYGPVELWHVWNVVKFKVENVFEKDVDGNAEIISILINKSKLRKSWGNLIFIALSHLDNEDFVRFVNENAAYYIKDNQFLDGLNSRNSYLRLFYEKILKVVGIEPDVFEDINESLIDNRIRPLILPTPDFRRDFAIGNIPINTSKIDYLLEYGLTRFSGSPSRYGFICTIVSSCFDRFLDQVESLGRSYGSSALHLFANVMILMDDNNLLYLDDEKIVQLFDYIHPDDFYNIRNIWLNEYDRKLANETMERVLSVECLNIWKKKYDVDLVSKFIDDNSNGLSAKWKNNSKAVLALDEQYNKTIAIAKKYGLSENAISESNFIPKHETASGVIIQHMRSKIRSRKTYALNILNSYKSQGSLTGRYINDFDAADDALFVIGRLIYRAAEEGETSCIAFLEDLRQSVSVFKGKSTINPVVCGVLFEVFFDEFGKLRQNVKTNCFDIVIENILDSVVNRGFINEMLSVYEDQVLYKPGDSILYFELGGSWSKIANEACLQLSSIKIYGCEILSKAKMETDEVPTPLKFLKDELQRLLAIPKNFIEFNFDESKAYILYGMKLNNRNPRDLIARIKRRALSHYT